MLIQSLLTMLSIFMSDLIVLNWFETLPYRQSFVISKIVVEKLHDLKAHFKFVAQGLN